MKKMKTMKKELLIATMLLSSWTAFAQSPFPTLNEDFYNATDHPSDLSTILIPASPLKYDVLFTGGVDYVHNAIGDSALAKEWQDFTGFVPIHLLLLLAQ